MQFNINAEQLARTTAVSGVQTSLDAEIADRQAADSSLEELLSGDIGTVQENLDAEAATRLANDNTLQSNIDAEATARQSAVSAESLARSNADEALANSITAEQNARLAEVAVERARIDSMLAGTSVDLNQLQELVTAYQTSDNDILAQITNI